MSCGTAKECRMTFNFTRRRALGLIASASLPLPAARAAGAISEASFVEINGIDQWISLRGRNAMSTAILFLHGGPGEAQSPFLERFASWEDDYVVVNWDQRGS